MKTKIIRCTNKVSDILMVGKLIFTKKGIKLTPEIMANSKVMSLVENKYLEIIEVDEEVKKVPEQKNDLENQSVVFNEVKQVEKIQVEEKLNSVVSSVESKKNENMPEVIVADDKNPNLKTFKPIDEALERDLKKLNEDLESIIEKKEIKIPEKKN